MRMIAAESYFVFPLMLLAFAVRSSATTACRDDGNYANRFLKRIPLHQGVCDPPFKLNLTGNLIKSIPSRAFENYLNLKVLIFSHNQVRTVEDGAFEGATNLSIVDLSHNNIGLLNRSFENASSVNDTNLAHNEIQSLESNTFKGATSVKFLDLSFNQISDVDDAALSWFPKLLKLELAHNKIDRLSESFLAWNTELERIDLSYNCLRSLSPKIFLNLTALFEVKLSHNPLYSIQFVFTFPSKSIYLDADNCGQLQIPDVQFDSGEIIIEVTFNIKCNCYTLSMEAKPAVSDCMDDVTQNVTNVTCFENEITTSSNIAYLGNTQTTATVLPIENRQSTEDVQSMQRMQSTDDMQIIGDKQSMENQNDKSRKNGFHKPITLSVLLITLTVSFIIFIIIITIIIIIFRRCWPKNC